MRRWDMTCFVFINIYGFILIGVMRTVKKEMTMDLGNMSGNRRGLTGTNIKYKRNNRYYETADKFVWHLRQDG